MQDTDRRLTTAQWVVIVLSALAFLLLALTYHDRISRFETAHRTLARTTTAEVASQVSFILSERQRQVALFAEYNLPALQALAGAPESAARYQAVESALRRSFPDFFAFTVTDDKGVPLMPDFEGYVGDVCVEDIQAFAKNGQYRARIHPNNHVYHYDVIARWKTGNGAPYMLMVSFAPSGLANLLRAIQPPGHELMLVSSTATPPVIEVTAKGGRNQIPRNDYHLTRSEMDRILAEHSVQQSLWKVADLVEPGFFATHRRQALYNLAGFVLVFVLLIAASLVLLRREERRRQEAEAAREELVAVITHEMRTPVTAISGTLSLLSNGIMGALPATMKDGFELLERNAERLRRLIDDLLECRLIESGQLSLDKRRIDLRQVAADSVAHMRDYASQLGVTIELAEGDGDVWVDADAHRLQQVVTNLISNAAKFSPAGAVVQVRVARVDGDTARLSVSDHGPGIPASFQPMVFRKFARGPAPANRQVASTGLGLSIVKALVEAHGGRVSFDTAEGAGTTFHVDLPRVERPVA